MEEKHTFASAIHQEDVDDESPAIQALAASAQRKLDFRLMPILTLVYLFAFIDRSNAGNARVLGMSEDLHLDAYRFNISLSCFYVPYILFEIPANIMCKIVGPKIWIPFLTFTFGVIVMSMASVQSYHGFLAARTFLGLAEAGIMPGITYCLSCFYRRRELVSRVGIYSSVASLSGAFGGLLAAAFAKVPAWGIMHTWRNIFFFEGIISMLIAVLAFFLIPASVEKAPFLTPAEKEVTARRLARDLGAGHVEVSVLRCLRRAVFNLNTILIAVASLCSLLTMNSMALFMPSILNALGYSGIHSQLLSVPPYCWAALVCVTVTTLSGRSQKRGIWITGLMPITATGFILLLTRTHTAVRYFALFLCLTGAFTVSPMFVAWCMDNTAGHMTRAIAAGAVVGFGNIGGLIAAWAYVLPDAPGYVKGHALNLGFAVFCVVVVCVAIWNLHRENQLKAEGRRDDRVVGKSPEDIQDLGHMHPEFYFTL
ncbi:major facilitator superfamily domain-containing protein [Aspergillus insuetus]